MIYEIPGTPIGVCGHHRCFPVVTLVGANKHFWRHCRGRHRLKYIDKVMKKFEIGIRLLNKLTWLCFLVFDDIKTGLYMTSFDLPQNFHSDPESLLRRIRARLVSPRRPLSVAELVIAYSEVKVTTVSVRLRIYSWP